MNKPTAIGGDTYPICKIHKTRFNSSVSKGGKCPLCLNPLISNYPTKRLGSDPIKSLIYPHIHSPQHIKAKSRKEYMRLYLAKNLEKLRAYKRDWARSSRAKARNELSTRY